MARGNLILDRYEPLGTAGSGGFGTVQIAWDPRIQRKVAIKTVQLTERDAFRASLPGAQAVAKGFSHRRMILRGRPSVGSGGSSGPSEKRTSGALSSPTADRWHGVLPWDEVLADEDEANGLGAVEDRFSAVAGEADSGNALGNASDADGTQGPDDSASIGFPALNERDGIAELDGDGGFGGHDDRENGGAHHSVDVVGEQVTSLSHLPGLDEARTAAKLTDPHIVAVYDFEVRDRTAYLIMEYVEGITLTKLLREYADLLTLDMVAGVFDAVAGALMAAHRASVLHLDIKPDNIIINADGVAKVTDFGLATLADASGVGTTGGGTIGYMPLEQMRREHLDVRTDEWSLAAVTYEMLTGDNPFRARSLVEAESAIEDAELVLPSLCWDNLDEQIDDVIFFALDPDREERYATVKGFAEEAEKFLGDPKRGERQLSLVVADALEKAEEEEKLQNAVARNRAEGNAPGKGGSVLPNPAQLAPKRRGPFGWFARPRSDKYQTSPSAGAGVRTPNLADRLREEQAIDADERDAGRYRDEPASDSRQSRQSRSNHRPHRSWRERVPHRAIDRTPLSERVPESASAIAARAFNAVACGFFAYFASSNIPILHTLFGAGELYAVAVCALIVAAVGVLSPVFGTLIAYCLFSLALVACGHPIVGGALLVVTLLWWYITGREGMANANVAALLPLVGSIGGNSVVPLVGGATLRPVQAIVTVSFAAIASIAFGSLGSGSMLGWDVFSHWDFTGADITGNASTMIVQPSTWTIAASWLAAAATLSLFGMGSRRWSYVIGLAIAVTLLLVGALAFAPLTPQLLVSVIVSLIVLLVV